MKAYLFTVADTTGSWLLVHFPSGHALRWRPWSVACVDYPAKDAAIWKAAFGRVGGPS